MCRVMARPAKRARSSCDYEDTTDEDEISAVPSEIRTDRRYCPHCRKSLSIKTFKAHRRLFCDSRTKEWYCHDDSEDESVFLPVNDPVESQHEFGYDSPPNSLPDGSDHELSEHSEEFCQSVSPPASDAMSDVGLDSEASCCDDVAGSDPGELEVWADYENDSDIAPEMDVTMHETPPNEEPLLPSALQNDETRKAFALKCWLVTFILLLQGKYHLTNQVIDLLFKFLKLFLNILGRFSSFCQKIASQFPSTLYKANKQHIHADFVRYVVCKRCHAIYFLKNCIEGSGMNQRSKTCLCNPFGRHRCGGLLLKSVELCTGRKIFYPFLTYCYVDIKVPLQALLLRPGLADKCEEWRTRSVREGTLAEVYDGNIWQEFQYIGDKPFLSEPYSYGFMINVDWFQPYKHTAYSVGVIFMTVMNLPRALRYKRENVLLIGILPGPHEPKLTMNSYLDPLVKELKQFCSGVELDSATGKHSVHCAIMCASCDMPAGRKLCGFLGHTATYGCTKCKKRFPGGVGNKDYSGYDRESWVYRTGEGHRKDAIEINKCKSKTAMQPKESSSGCRYSSLLKLPYFNAPRMLVVDPMHNLFTGTAKHYIKHILLGHELLSMCHFDIIQDRVNRTVVSPDIGRIPSKIESGFSSFTADQLKNWTVYYSILTLHDILVGNNLECWRHFVLACRILCSRRVTKEQLQLADAFLLQFCKRIERMYGKDATTPNMHMHCHLKDCIEDYGPMSGFWLFPYERFNGLLGEFSNNNRSIEVQLMKRFLWDQSILTLSQSVDLPDDFNNEFGEIVNFGSDPIGSVGDTLNPLPCDTVVLSSWVLDDLHISIPAHFTRCVFDAFELECLKKMYSSLYSIPVEELNINSSYHKYSSIILNTKVLGSYRSRSHSSSLVIATCSHLDVCTKPADQ